MRVLLHSARFSRSSDRFGRTNPTCVVTAAIAIQLVRTSDQQGGHWNRPHLLPTAIKDQGVDGMGWRRGSPPSQGPKRTEDDRQAPRNRLCWHRISAALHPETTDEVRRQPPAFPGVDPEDGRRASGPLTCERRLAADCRVGHSLAVPMGYNEGG